MKALIAIAAVLVLGYLIAAPYLTAYQIQRAADAGDSAAVAEHIDFDSVRESLRPQLQGRVSAAAAEAAGDDPLAAALGGAAGRALTDHAVDATVTPEGIARLMRGEANPDGAVAQRMENVEASAGYRSLNRFAVVLTDAASGNEVELIFERRGLGWKVTEIQLPDA